MHFNEAIAHKLAHADRCTAEMVTEAHAEYKKMLAKSNASVALKKVLASAFAQAGAKGGGANWMMALAKGAKKAQGDAAGAAKPLDTSNVNQTVGPGALNTDDGL